jgi:hypothetical protein
VLSTTGETNAQIASTLVVRPETVKKHLDHVHAGVGTPGADAPPRSRSSAPLGRRTRCSSQTAPRTARSRSPSCTVADPPTGST